MMIFCMLLTQYTKKILILKSQYSVPNLISELQSDKNKGKQARDIRWRHQSNGVCLFFLAWNKSMPALNLLIYQMDKGITKKILSTPETQPLTADQQSLYDST